MTTVAFTDEFYPKSSAVDEAFYDENTQTVYVDLHDNIYAYSGVDKVKWERFKRSGDGAGSVGSFYAGSIKRSHGPGRNLGHVRGIEYKKVAVRNQDAAGTPKGLTPTATAPQYHSLNVQTGAVSGNGTSRFVVTFRVGSAALDKKHEVKAKDELDALRQVNTFAEALGVSLKVRSVTHYFE